MISPASIAIRCDGIDRATLDTCKSSVVLTIDVEDITCLNPNLSSLERGRYFVAKLPGWKIQPDALIFCPDCKP